jgi:hypothetical protein
MDTRTGDIYENVEEAMAAGVPEDRLVTGSKEAIANLSARIRALDQRGSFKNLPRRPTKGDE